MERRKWKQPERENPHEARVMRAVNAAGVSAEEKPFYAAFAREIDRALRSTRRGNPNVETRMTIEARSPNDRFAGVLEQLSVGVPAFCGFSEAVKRVAAKWFARGLSGHKLWLIGRELAGIGQSREA